MELAIPNVPVLWRRIVIGLEGVTPLLMHNPKGMRSEDVAKQKHIPTPEEEAQGGLYSMDTGELYVKADHVRMCMLNGATGMKVRGKSLKQILAASVMETEPWFILTRDGTSLLRYDRIDSRRAVVQRNGVIRSRPVIEVPWTVEASFLFDLEVVREPLTIVQSLQRGGQVVGLLDYRPQKGGTFGRFVVAYARTDDI